jgi:hypothetical protein
MIADQITVADEISWPACLFILEHLMKQIIKIEKEEDSSIMTRPHLIWKLLQATVMTSDFITTSTSFVARVSEGMC